MSEQIKQIAQRLKGIREIEGLSTRDFAKTCEIPVDLYEEYEKGETDIPVSFLYDVAGKMGIELVALLTGIEPHLQKYSLVKNGEGLDVERSKQYKYKNLAYKMQQKKAEPFLVTVEPQASDAPISMNSHPGQEINYVIEGTLIISIDGKELLLEEGDTLYYNSSHPHGMKAVGDKSAKFLAIII